MKEKPAVSILMTALLPHYYMLAQKTGDSKIRGRSINVQCIRLIGTNSRRCRCTCQQRPPPNKRNVNYESMMAMIPPRPPPPLLLLLPVIVLVKYGHKITGSLILHLWAMHI